MTKSELLDLMKKIINHVKLNLLKKKTSQSSTAFCHKNCGVLNHFPGDILANIAKRKDK